MIELRNSKCSLLFFVIPNSGTQGELEIFIKVNPVVDSTNSSRFRENCGTYVIYDNL